MYVLGKLITHSCIYQARTSLAPLSNTAPQTWRCNQNARRNNVSNIFREVPLLMRGSNRCCIASQNPVITANILLMSSILHNTVSNNGMLCAKNAFSWACIRHTPTFSISLGKLTLLCLLPKESVAYTYTQYIPRTWN